MVKRSLLAETLVENDKWLRSRGVVMDDLVVDTLPDPTVKIQGKKVVSFSSNNYLGLSRRKEVMTAALAGLKKYGPGTCESRRLGGDLIVLERLEETIAEYKGTEDSIIFATGMMANMGAIPAITDSDFYINKFFSQAKKPTEVIILGDQLNHRSIQIGIKLSRAVPLRYKHNDMTHLEELLDEHKDKPILIVTDGVFSMDGDIAPLGKIVALAKHYRAGIYVDDAHGTGVHGRTGRGSAEHFGVEDEIDFKMGTLSKAFGGLGGFVAAERGVIDMLKSSASTYYFTSSLPAEQAAGLIAAINIAKKEPDLRKNLWRNVSYMAQGLKDLGLEFPLQWSQIIPVIIGEESKTLLVEKYLLDNGVQCSGVTPPAVAPGRSRLRISINATHKKAHIDKLLECLESATKKFKLPKIYKTEEEWKRFKEATPDYINEFLA